MKRHIYTSESQRYRTILLFHNSLTMVKIEEIEGVKGVRRGRVVDNERKKKEMRGEGIHIFLAVSIVHLLEFLLRPTSTDSTPSCPFSPKFRLHISLYSLSFLLFYHSQTIIPILSQPPSHCGKKTTEMPRNTGSQGTDKFSLLLADFRYCQFRK